MVDLFINPLIYATNIYGMQLGIRAEICMYKAQLGIIFLLYYQEGYVVKGGYVALLTFFGKKKGESAQTI